MNAPLKLPPDWSQELVIPPSNPGDPTWGVALLFPSQGSWTERDYLSLDTNLLVELSDGCLEFLPMPVLFHQLLLKYLTALLDRYVVERNLGVVAFAPLPVRLWTGKMREPDLVFFRSERVKDPFAPVQDGADLAVEIVSAGAENRKHDCVTKRAEYAKAGIAEYWIVDSEAGTVTVLTLHGGTYREHGVFRTGDRANSVLLPGFVVDVTALFEAGNVHGNNA